jgi:hypothetical protein
MSELAGKKYVPELDHYLKEVDYHLYLDTHIDKFLLDHYSGDIKEFMDHEKSVIADALAYKIKECKLDSCIITNDIVVAGCPVQRLEANVWIFSKAELERFKEEVRAEALSGK